MMFHALTLILVVLKALEMITISWWWCVAPSLVAIGFFLVIAGSVLSLAGLAAFFHLKK
jgi:hypothetical protein